MLRYTLELERKIAAVGLDSQKNTLVVLALCGNGSHWEEDDLDEFVSFYISGVHRVDDAFSKMETHDMARKRIDLARTVSQFAYLERSQRSVTYDRMNWNVQPPIGRARASGGHR